MLGDMPELEDSKNTDVLGWSLRNAKDCSFLGNILATLILGAKGVSSNRLFGFIKRYRRRKLATELMNEYTPTQISQLTSELLQCMDIGSFFHYFFPSRTTPDETDKNRSDSVWAVIGGALKNYPNFTLDNVLYDMSYANVILFSSVLPSYETESNDTSSKSTPTKKKGLSFNEFLGAMKGYNNE